MHRFGRADERNRCIHMREKIMRLFVKQQHHQAKPITIHHTFDNMGESFRDVDKIGLSEEGGEEGAWALLPWAMLLGFGFWVS
ncbi:Uncharacterized protein TCM_038266 [Theobroma cacao]|uniref:Uncharacterized protein n=1 Tax=Theobroma cacao TaxID=3641 RepID=A0A061GPI1_THECC|nr:Uncharacterized protein TCM_038266 [Theobroma cacao]